MYRRNQVEGAIARCKLETNGPDGQPSATLRQELKRLIDTDRTFPHPGEGALRSEARPAFSSGGNPGKGAEQSYEIVDAFALLIALELSRAGLPQRRAVRKTRILRQWLQAEADGRLGALAQDVLNGLGDRQEERLVAGNPVEQKSKRVFLAIDGRVNLPTTGQRLDNIFAGDERILDVLDCLDIGHGPVMVLDISNAFVRLVYWLPRILPARRGRPT